MKKLTYSKVSACLFAAADALRGPLLEPLDLLAGLVLLKRAHDQPGFLRTPDPSPWAVLEERLLDHRQLGSLVTKCFHEIEAMNRDLLGGVFEFADVGRVSASSLREAIDILNQVSFANGALEFPDIIGRAFDASLGREAEYQGKRGGSFYTPRSVVELMVRLVEPQNGNSVLDPFLGSGGMLIKAREFVKEKEGNGADLQLFGQELNYGTCARAQLNFLLHEVTDFEMSQGNSLSDPAFEVGDMLREFDRVLCNPPFSLKYDELSVRRPERMRYGRAAHADLMNIQHVMASLGPMGRGAVVAPHGVLFRMGAEAGIRKGIVESGRLVAVIGIGPNVFYGTAIPACVLVLDGEARNGRPPNDDVLFINAEREIVSGRTRNRLAPQNIEKIVAVFQERATLPGFSRTVSLEEIEENDFSLSIRLYVEPSASPSPLPDATALISGGIPKNEVQAEFDCFRAHGIVIEDLFQEKDERYYNFREEGWESIASRIPELGSIKRESLLQSCSDWWKSSVPRLTELHANGRILQERDVLRDDFITSLQPVGILDRYGLAGVFASWWSDNKDELRGAGFSIEKLGDSLRESLARQVAAELRQLVELFQSWGERYGTSLADLDTLRTAGAAALKRRLDDLGFSWP